MKTSNASARPTRSRRATSDQPLRMPSGRAYSRVAYDAIAVLWIAGSPVPGRTVDVSLGGAFVRTTAAAALGTPVVLQLDLPEVPFPSAIRCFVRWIKPDEGVGLQFERLRPIEVWAINRIVRPPRDGSP